MKLFLCSDRKTFFAPNSVLKAEWTKYGEFNDLKGIQLTTKKNSYLFAKVDKSENTYQCWCGVDNGGLVLATIISNDGYTLDLIW